MSEPLVDLSLASFEQAISWIIEQNVMSNNPLLPLSSRFDFQYQSWLPLILI